MRIEVTKNICIQYNIYTRMELKKGQKYSQKTKFIINCTILLHSRSLCEYVTLLKKYTHALKNFIKYVSSYQVPTRYLHSVHVQVKNINTNHNMIIIALNINSKDTKISQKKKIW